MPKVQVECPSCGSILNVSDEKLGKKIRCTDCSEVFVADEVDEDGGGSRGSTRAGKKTRPSPSRKKGRGSKKSSGGSNPTIAIVGGIVALGLIVVGLYASGLFSSKQAPQQPLVAETSPLPVAQPAVAVAEAKVPAIKWMPVETDVYIHIKVAELLALPQVKTWLGELETSGKLADAKRITGLSVDDVVSISLGLVDAMGAWERSEKATAAGQAGTNALTGVRTDDERTLIVVSTKKGLDVAQLQQQVPMSEVKERNQRKYLEFPSPHNMSSKSGLWTPDDKTIIFGTLADVLGTIDRGETVTPRSEFANIAAAPTILVATAFKPQAPATDSEPSLSKSFRGALADYAVQGAQFAILIREGFDLDVTAVCGSPESATKLKGVLDEFLANDKTLPTMAAMANLSPVVEQLKSTLQGQSVTLSTHVPESALAMAASMPSFSKPTPTSSNPASETGTEDSQSPYLGESQRIQPAEVSGLPPGLKITLRTAWRKQPIRDFDKLIKPMCLLYEIEGSDVRNIAAVGQIRVLAAPTTATGENIYFILSPAESRLLRVAAPHLVEPGATPTKLQFVLFLPEPPPNAIPLKEVRFSFACLMGNEFDDYVIENAAQAQTAINDPKLSKAGIKLVLEKGFRDGGLQDSLKLTWDPGYSFRSGSIVFSPNSQPQSVPLELEADPAGPYARAWKLAEDIPFSGTETLKFQLFRDLKKQEVVVKFKDIPSPVGTPPESKTDRWAADGVFACSGFDARDLSYSHDGKLLACGGGDGAVDLWNLTDMRPLTSPRGSDGESAPIAFHPSKSLLAFANNSFQGGPASIVLWDPATQKQVASIKAGSAIYALRFTPEGTLLAVQKDSVSFWDVEKQSHAAPVLKIPGVFNGVVSPDGSMLATVSNKSLVKVWDMKTRKEKRSLKMKGRVPDVAFTPNGRSLAVVENGTGIRRWDTESWQEQQGVQATYLITSIAFSPDGLLMATGTEDGTVALWERSNFRLIAAVGGHADAVYGLVFSPDSKWLASGGDDDLINRWNITGFSESLAK